MDTISCMKAFTVVVETGGFSSAARKTRQSKNLLSKYVAQLETSLNTRLLNRTTRHVSTTPAGQAYYEGCKPLLSEFEDLQSSLLDTHSQPKGQLRITAPMSFSELHLMPVIADLSKSYPELEIDLLLSDRMIDIVDLGIDVALRIGNLTDSSLVARKITQTNTKLCCSPNYLKQFGTPQTPHDLIQHQCIFDTNITEKKQWQYTQNNLIHTLKLNGSVSVNNVLAVKELILQDMGIGLCPDFVIGDDLINNDIVTILDNYDFYNMSLYAVYPHRRHLSGKVRMFIDALISHFD
jgi:DNA-binding transcriptional LysR family regulator